MVLSYGHIADRISHAVTCLVLISLNLGEVYAQANKTLQISSNDQSEKTLAKYDLPESVNDDDHARLILKDLVISMINDGHLEVSIDSLLSDSLHINAFVHSGPEYKWIKMSSGNIPQELLEVLRFPKDSFEGRPLIPSQYGILTERILKYFENHGYPFAEIKMINLKIENSGMYGELQLRRNELFKMDTLDIQGNADVNKSFLYNYLGFKPGEHYDERIISSIDRKLNQLPYVKKLYNSKVYFIRDKARVVLYIDKRKTDRLDGIVGLAPNSNSSKKDMLLTGEVNADLNNLAGSGMALDMHWKSFLENSSELNLGFLYPYLFHTPLGIDLNAELQRFDTITTNISYDVGVQYLFRGNNHVRVFFRNNFSILQSADTALVRVTRAIPWSNPVDIKTYGLDLFYEQLDYKINPRKGYSSQVIFSIGKKTIKRDNRIDAVKFLDEEENKYSVYDSADLDNLQGNIQYRFQYFQPIFKKSALVTTVSGKHIIASQIFFNELYRIGGNNLLRGYDENSILASSYTVGMLEYRYLLSQNSYFNVFVNSAYYENNNVETERLISGFPLGFGAGINLEVKAGILTMAYALGTDSRDRIDFSRAKIHFGIINYL